MKLSTADLERLAALYGATVHQLSASPEAAEMVATLDGLQEIAADMDPETLREWMALGRKLIRK